MMTQTRQLMSRFAILLGDQDCDSFISWIKSLSVLVWVFLSIGREGSFWFRGVFYPFIFNIELLKIQTHISRVARLELALEFSVQELRRLGSHVFAAMWLHFCLLVLFGLELVVKIWKDHKLNVKIFKLENF